MFCKVQFFDSLHIDNILVTRYNSCKLSTNSKEYGKKWHLAHKKERNAQIRAYQLNREKELKNYIILYLFAHPCLDCGEKDIIVLEFDHVRGIKKANVSELLRRGYSLRTLKNEIEKCEIVCANDHARRTAKRANTFKNAFLAQSGGAVPL